MSVWDIRNRLKALVLTGDMVRVVSAFRRRPYLIGLLGIIAGAWGLSPL